MQQKGSNMVYKIDRKIICYRHGYTCCIGKPSDATVASFTALSENIAHECCMEICENRILVAMKYANPTAYHAHQVLNALA